jgi:hypothetical protein
MVAKTRTKKVVEKDENIEIPEQVIWDVLQFAKTLQSSSVYQNIFTPDLINSQMKSISYNPLQTNQDMLDKALIDPKNNEDNLRSFGEGFEAVSQTYKRLISYLANLPSFDWTYAAEVNDPKEYKTTAYQKDLERVFGFFDHFNPRKEFGSAIKQMIRNETYFFALNQSGNEYVLQEMPWQFCKITGRWDKGLLYSLNEYLFMMPGISIDMFHPFFKDSFSKLFDNTTRIYNPAIELDRRGMSTWVYWQDVPPDVGWAFKLTPEMATSAPFFSPLYSDLINAPLYRNLQKSKSMASAVRLLYGTIPLLSGSGGAQTKLKDAIALSPDLTARFLTLLKSALSSSVTVGASPLESVSAISFPTETDIYQESMQTALSASGVNTPLVFSNTLRQNIFESQASLEVDFLIVKKLYQQFNDFMDFQLSKITKKYKFHVYFEGMDTKYDRDERLNSATGLAGLGMVLPQAFAASRGIPPHVFLRQLAEAKAMGFVDNLTPIVPAAQQKDGGAPQKASGDLSESGAATRGQGNNLGRGGKV